MTVTALAATPADRPGQPRNYTRWRNINATTVAADILGSRLDIQADTAVGQVFVDGMPFSCDEARMYGVRLVEAAALADGARAFRQQPEQR